MTAETIVQSLLSGLLTGLIYALIAVGLSLIFGLMDVVNFTHGEFLMAAMYATLACTLALAIDPIISAPLVAGLIFVFGGLVTWGSSASRCAPGRMWEWCRSSRPLASPS